MQPAPPTPPSRVPDELVGQLDEANSQFHQAKEHLESELDSFEPEREHRLEAVRKELHDAEQNLEDITRKINPKLDPPRP